MSRRPRTAARLAVALLTLAALLPSPGAAAGDGSEGGMDDPARGRYLRLGDQLTFDGVFANGAQVFPDPIVLSAQRPRTRVTVWPYEAAIVHVDAPIGSRVQVTLKHHPDSFVRLAGVGDAMGRFFDPDSVRRTTTTIQYEGVPVFADGGLDFALENGGDVASISHVAIAIDDSPGELGEPLDLGPLAWAPGRFLAEYASTGLTAAELADELGVDVIEDHGGFAVLSMDPCWYGSEWQGLGGYGQLFPGGVGTIEVDAMAMAPEGSQRNFIVIGSEWGRAYPRQPALRAIHMQREHPLDGEGMVIAIVDTGVDDRHDLLYGKVLLGRDFVDGDDLPREQRTGLDLDGDGYKDEAYGHGTMVASIALSVAPRAKILPVRVLDSDGRGTVSGVAAGVRYAADNGANVINLSLGTSTESQVLTEAVAWARAKGCVVVVASGNSGNAWNVDFPGTIPGVISVSALNQRGHKPGWSNGRKVADVVHAPGAGIIGAFPGNTWGHARGTSFSAPLVSGAAALAVQSGVPGFDTNRIVHEVVSDVTANDLRLDLRRLMRPWPAILIAKQK